MTDIKFNKRTMQSIYNFSTLHLVNNLFILSFVHFCLFIYPYIQQICLFYFLQYLISVFKFVNRYKFIFSSLYLSSFLFYLSVIYHLDLCLYLNLSICLATSITICLSAIYLHQYLSLGLSFINLCINYIFIFLYVLSI